MVFRKMAMNGAISVYHRFLGSPRQCIEVGSLVTCQFEWLQVRLSVARGFRTTQSASVNIHQRRKRLKGHPAMCMRLVLWDEMPLAC
jgi:hypothetical protein